ncbi:hypothetical protein E4U42_005691 [Claviceps africana]|uniref:GRF-like zinc ribbon domain-containing protein n=1 Tax=Claviceps africana TaxID=83212 RepID=A0A8K0NH90_9HYPO|nr:hypothetical protein E4U42_005691 [Claviceps africana]
MQGSKMEGKATAAPKDEIQGLKAPKMGPNTPVCLKCDKPTVRRITRQSNRNGNAGRPYYICIPCNKFSCFTDDRGKDPGNPPCDCGVPSRRQVACREKGRKVHFVCMSGKCDFYRTCFDAEGDVVAVETDALLDLLKRLSII